MIEGIDLKHLLNWRYAGNRLLRELADAKGERARQLTIEIDWAAAHACDHAGILRFGPMQPHQNDVALGAVHVAQHSENFHIHGFRLDTLKHCEGCALHALVDLIERYDVWAILGRRWQSGCKTQQRGGKRRDSHGYPRRSRNDQYLFDSACCQNCFARGGVFFTASKISQPQSCCIYTSTGIFEDFP